MSSFRRAFVVKRKATGSITNGIFTEGATSTINITASIQPLKPSEIQQLPEGRRNRKVFWVITSTKLNVVSTTNPDIITVGTENFELDSAEEWQNNVINHYKYMAMKV